MSKYKNPGKEDFELWQKCEEHEIKEYLDNLLVQHKDILAKFGLKVIEDKKNGYVRVKQNRYYVPKINAYEKIAQHYKKNDSTINLDAYLMSIYQRK